MSAPIASAEQKSPLITPEHGKYLTQRAIPIEVAKRAGVRSVDAHEGARVLGRTAPLKSGGLAFPYPGTDPPYVRVRLDEPDDDARYLAPENVPVPVYYPLAELLPSDGPIVVVESPAKAMAVTNAGYRSVGLGGVSTTLARDTMEPSLNESWAGSPKGSTVICFDSNRASNPDVALAEARLAIALEAAGRPVAIASLPPNADGTDWGPDDFIAAKGPLAIKEIITAAVPANPVTRTANVTNAEALTLLADVLFLISVNERGIGCRHAVADNLKRQGVSHTTFKDALKKTADKAKAVRRRRAAGKREKKFGNHKFPLIDIGGQRRDLFAAGKAALVDANKRKPSLFSYGGTVARVISRGGCSQIAIADVDATHGQLTRVATFYRIGSEGYVDAVPPKDLSADILSYPPKLPELENVANTPVFGADGKLIRTPGYHAGERLWVDLPRGFDVPQIAGQPDSAEVGQATELLVRELMGDFPFVDDASRAHAVSAIISLFCRRLVTGPTPLHAIDAAKAGTGKGLLADVISIICTGHEADVMAQADSDEETRKRLTAKLIEGAPLILIDNVTRRLDSAVLAAALTALRWNDRILGVSQTAALPVTCLWLATGNNLRFSDEMARRTAYVRLDARVEMPHMRTGFRHSSLARWAKEHRTELVRAALTLIQAWIAAGRPQGKKTLGRFESWAETLGGILDVAGLPGFLGNVDRVYEELDEDRAEWRAFVVAWWTKHSGQRVGAKELFDLATAQELLAEVLGTKDSQSQRVRLGRALGKKRDQIISGYRIVECEHDNRGRRNYLLEPWVSRTSATSADLGTNLGIAQHAAAAGVVNVCAGVAEVFPNSQAAWKNPGDIVEKNHVALAAPDATKATSACGEKAKLDQVVTPAEVVAEVTPRCALVSSIACSPTSPPEFPVPAHELVVSQDRAAEVCVQLAAAPRLAVDIETYAADDSADGALDPFRNRIRLVQLTAGDAVFIFDIDALGMPCPLRNLLDWATPKVGHNLKFDAKCLLHHFGIEIGSPVDTYAGAVLINAYSDLRKKGAYTLQTLVARYLDRHLPKEHAASDWGATRLSAEQLEYAARDPAAVLALHDRLRTEAERLGVMQAWRLENDIIVPVSHMELAGFPIDREAAGRRAEELVESVAAAEALAKDQLGGINIRSTQQVKAAVRERLQVDLQSTTEDEIEARIGGTEAGRVLLAYRRDKALLDKLRGWLGRADSAGRIHANFKQLGAETGRFTCSRPALQQVPREKAIRALFRPGRDSAFVIADYSAIELRVAADLIPEPALQRVFRDGADPHSATAAFVLSKEVGAVTKAERQHGKAVGFGFIYGMGARRFIAYAQANYGVTLQLVEAQQLRRSYLERYSGIAAWHEATARNCPVETRTKSGRLRRWDEFRFTEALNTSVQGTAADGAKRAMALLHERLKSPGGQIVGFFHDEFVVEVPSEKAEECSAIVVDAMKEGMAEYLKSVPIEVEAWIADSWSKP